MKKMMIAAFALSCVAGTYAAGCNDDPEPTDSCVTVFDVKFSGKTAVEYKNEYKKIQKLSGKGALSMDGEGVSETLEVKIGSDKSVVALDGDVTKFTYFGKNLATVLNKSLYKPGKTYTLESDLGLTASNQDDTEVSVNQVAFGKVKVYISKDKTIPSHCDDPVVIPGCVPYVTPVSYSGWFTGSFKPICLDEANYNDYCYEFGGSEIAIFGGTWTAKYNKKLSVAGSIVVD